MSCVRTLSGFCLWNVKKCLLQIIGKKGTTFSSKPRLIECSSQLPDLQFPRFRFPLSATKTPHQM